MGKLAGTGVLMVWVDLEESAMAEADRWYEQEHFPERVTRSGYLRARRFRALSGTPAHMGLLEASAPDELAGEGYKRVTANINEQSRRMRRAFRRIIRTPHAVVVSTGTFDGAVMLCARLQFARAEQRAAFNSWAKARFESWAGDRPEILGAHALSGAPDIRNYMDSFRASGQNDESADATILLEFGRPEDADALAEELRSEVIRALGLDADAVAIGTYQLMFDMAQRHFMPEKGVSVQ